MAPTAGIFDILTTCTEVDDNKQKFPTLHQFNQTSMNTGALVAYNMNTKGITRWLRHIACT
jgi:ABC-type transporter MlaC component